MADRTVIEHQGQRYDLTPPRTTSPSAHKDYQICPGLSWWKKVAGVKEDAADPLVIGIAVAELAEAYMLGRKTMDEVRAVKSIKLPSGKPSPDIGQLTAGALGYYPAPESPRVHVEEWLDNPWPAGTRHPRIAQKPDLLIAPLIKGVHEHARGGAGGSGLFYEPPEWGVLDVCDIKTTGNYKNNLTEATLGSDTQMIWYARGGMIQYGAERARLRQPQVHKRSYEVRHPVTHVTRDEVERVFARTMALQREMDDVWAIRDPAELAQQGLLRWNQCANQYGRPCPMYDRCGAWRPSAGPRMTLGELARVAGRAGNGDSTVAQDTLTSKLFGEGSPLAQAQKLRDAGSVTPPDGPGPDLTPDQLMGVDEWKHGKDGKGRPYWIASGRRHGVAWNAYGQGGGKGVKVYAPAYVPRSKDNVEPFFKIPGDMGGFNVIQAREVLQRAFTKWDNAEAAEGRYIAATAPAGRYRYAKDDLTAYAELTGAAGDRLLDFEGLGVRVEFNGETPPSALDAPVAVDPFNDHLTRMVEDEETPEDEGPADLLPDDDEGDGDDPDFLPDDDEDTDSEDDGGAAPATTQSTAPGAPLDIMTAIQAAVDEQTTPPEPQGPSFDVAAASKSLEDAGLPAWAIKRIPTELQLDLDGLKTMIAEKGDEGLMAELMKLRSVGDGKAQDVVDAVRAQGVPEVKASAAAGPQVLDPEYAAREAAELDAREEKTSETSDTGGHSELEKTLLAKLVQRDEWIVDLEAKLARASLSAETPAKGYRLIFNGDVLPGGAAPLESVLLEDLLREHITAACERLKVPDLRMDRNAFGDPFKEVLRELYADEPPTDRVVLVDPFSQLWKGVGDWFMARRAWAIRAK